MGVNRVNESRPIRLLLLLLVITVGTSACTATHIYQADPLTPKDRPRGNDPWTDWKDKPLTIWLWGAVRQDLPVVNCRLGDGTPTGIHEVRVKKNFGQRLITYLSLGLIDPVTYGWRCQRPPQTGGVLN